MIFKALACDYDGTLASNNRIGEEAIAALGRAREAGLRLVLVTGRTFFDLLRVCERVDLFDAVVAENGGVLYFPPTGMIRDKAPPPPPRLLAELDRRGIPFQVGRVIVGTGRADEEAVRAALAAVGTSHELVYNRAALMLLPPGISKGAGVRQVVRDMGLSFHDVLALGDAENDIDLFEVCGWTGCPADAIPDLKDRADWVFPDEDGVAIARAIVGPILDGLLPVARSPRHWIALGWAVGSSEPVGIPARGVNVLIQGDPLSGKSWLAGRLIERLHSQRYAACAIDPEGDFHVLARLPSVTWTEVREEGSMARALAHFERDPSACVVMDLSALPHVKKVRLIGAGLARIRELRRRLGLPHWVILDEAHYSLHCEGIRDEAIGIKDKGFCLVTYKASWLRESVSAGIDAFLLACTTVPEELAFLRSFLSQTGARGGEAIEVLPALPRGEFLLIQPYGTDDRTASTFTASPRETPHVRHQAKYADSPLSPERRFFFRGPDGAVEAIAGSLNDFRRAVAAVEDSVLAHHAGRGDFSRWLFDVFNDYDLGEHLRKIERRWTRGEISNLRQAIERLIAAYYGADR